MSRAWSAKPAGTPAGWSNAGSSRADCASAAWMRRSMSRTASRYSPSRAASLGPRPRLRSAAFPRTESRRLRRRLARARRAAGSVLPPSPNMRSNTTRGLCSIGSGVRGPRHEMVWL